MWVEERGDIDECVRGELPGITTKNYKADSVISSQKELCPTKLLVCILG